MRTAIFAAFLLPAVSFMSSCGPGPSQPAPSEQATLEPVEDIFIECGLTDYDGSSGLTVSYNFLVIDGEAKRYDARNNMAVDMCPSGQEGCSLIAGDGKIVSDYTAPSNGTRTVTSVDVNTLEISEKKTTEGEAERTVSHTGSCEEKPIPQI